MDISSLTQELSALWGAASDMIPEDITKLLAAAASAIPKDFDIGSSFKFILIFAAALLGVGLLARVLLATGRI